MKIPKIKIIEDSKIIAEQAEEISKRVLSLRESATIGAEENPLREARKALEADSIKARTKPLRIKPGTIADPRPLNDLFRSVKEDLEILFRANTSLEDALVFSYNTIATKENDLIGELKTLRSKISTLKLYAREITDDDQYLSLSFTDGTEIGIATDGTPATYDEAQGALLLPIVASVSPKISSVTINDSSNGVVGNNHDRSRQRHGSVQTIIDGSVHTWFEYERITSGRSGSLRLILNLKLETPTMINRISVNPANLGTSNWVKIEDIQVQVGQRFVSIKEDVLSPSWDPTDDPFKLSPAASKFAGQGIFSFSPKLATSIQITLVQDEPYPILNNRKLRYAIAIREIEIQQVEYSDEAYFTLTPQSFQRAVRSIGLIHNINPFDEKLAEITYSISTDNGDTWTDLAVLDNKDAAKLEALVLDEKVTDVVLKGKIKRISNGFAEVFNQGSSELIDKSTVLRQGTTSAPITLEATPQTYLEVIETRLGAQGDTGNRYFLGAAHGSLGSTQRFELPIEYDKNDISILVSGEEWERAYAFTAAGQKKFIYDTTGDKPAIILGDGISIEEEGMGGAVPTAGSEIYLKVVPLENPQITSTEEGLEFHLKYDSSKVKDSTKVYAKDLIITQTSFTAGPGSNRIQLPEEHADIIVSGLFTSELNYIDDGTEVPFQNGEVEFENLEDGDYYSIDTERSRIYLSEAIPLTGGDLTVEYGYTLRKLIPSNKWKYAKKKNSIIVDKDAVPTKIRAKTVAARVLSRVIDLDGDGLATRPYSIIKGSIRGVDQNGIIGISRVLETEIEFINGSTEFTRLRSTSDSFLGFFSVDYENNRIHLPDYSSLDAEDRGFLPGRILYNYLSSEIHYGLGKKLQENLDYTVSSRVIEPTAYYLDSLDSSNRRLSRSTDLHIRYDIKGDVQVNGSLVEKFYTPVLRDIAIIGIGIDPRLGTLESL